MRYIKLGTTGLDVSPIAIGAMTYGDPGRGHPVWSLDEETSRPLIKHALEAGINFFDTANMYSYGSSEEILGRALKDFADRDDVVIATKLRHPMRPGPNGEGPVPQGDHDRGRPQPAAARHRLHRPLPDPPQRPRDAARGDPRGPARPGQGGQGPLPRRVLDARLGVRQGPAPAAPARLGPVRVHAGPLQPARPRGGTRDDPALPRRGRRHHRLEPARPRPPGPPLGGRQVDGTGRDRRRRTRTCSTPRSPPTATTRSSTPSARSRPTRGVTRAQVALAWLRSKPVVTAPLVGANTTAQIDDAVASLDIELTAEELAALERPYTPRYDFQGISDEAELQKIRDQIPGYANA